ncbi:DNA-binding protein [Streptomyces sp. NPDC052396]|uniref:DNA-binding protein n=1 Tax=Streptomyces sp. NPDC052396 TaxID=3365689 RepID=UPI0037CCFCC8
MSRHSITDVTLPRLYRPVEIAEALGCSEWWVKEQARKRRVPFTRVGGAYRFTADHFAEIVRVFEERPQLAGQELALPQSTGRRPARPNPAAAATGRLRAKRPPRATRHEQVLSAA